MGFVANLLKNTTVKKV